MDMDEVYTINPTKQEEIGILRCRLGTSELWAK